MKLQLAFCPGACAIAPYILLTEAGADFETLNINLSKGDHKTPAYLKLNPKGKVPALIMGDRVLTENLAIQLWIHHTYPQAGLMPADPFEYMQAVSVLSWFGSGIHPKLTQQARPERYCILDGSADSVKSLGSDAMLELFEMANHMLAGKDWFFDHFSCADAYFYWCFTRGAAFGKDLSVYTNCQSHLERMKQRPSVQALMKHETEVRLGFGQGG
jgi:glutathione S-transferase